MDAVTVERALLNARKKINVAVDANKISKNPADGGFLRNQEENCTKISSKAGVEIK